MEPNGVSHEDVLLLQTSLETAMTAARSKLAAKSSGAAPLRPPALAAVAAQATQGKVGHTSHARVGQLGEAAQAHDMCFQRLASQLDVAFFEEAVQGFGVMPSRAACAERHGVPSALLQGATMGNSTSASDAALVNVAPGTVYLLGLYCVVYAIVFVQMLRLLFGKPETHQPQASKSVFRPELESWKQSYFSWFSIGWATPWVVQWGRSQEDLVKINVNELHAHGDPGDESIAAYEEFDRIWREDVARRGTRTNTLIWVILRFVGWGNCIKLIAAMWMLECAKYLGMTFSINWLLNMLATLHQQRVLWPDSIETEQILRVAVAVMTLLSGVPLVVAFFNTITFMIGYRMNIRVTAALTAFTYAKAQRLPASLTAIDLRTEETKKMMKDKPGGKDANYSLVQLVNTDISTYLNLMFVNVCRLACLLPVLVILVGVLFWQLRKATIIAVLAAMTCMGLVQMITNRYQARLKVAQDLTGLMLSAVQETLDTVRIVKSYGWEAAARQKLVHLRSLQLNQLWWFMFWIGTMLLTMVNYPRILIISSLAGYMAIYGGIEPTHIFIMFQLLNAFKTAMNVAMTVYPNLVNVMPAVGRLDRFFKLPEAVLASRSDSELDLTPRWVSLWHDSRNTEEPRQSLKVRGTFRWPSAPAEAEPLLKDVDVDIAPGEMVAIVGKVGAGKSTLLCAMMAELEPVGDARVEVPKKLSYHAQVAYTCEGTLRENVIFGSEFDELRYSEAIHAACLRQDLDILPGGDSVPIGGRGVALSGGQRARVSLARAAYADTSVVLIDDPFSSLDGPTSHAIQELYLQGNMLSARTRVVVCHPDVERIKIFDRVIVMAEGRVIMQGSPGEVINTDVYQELLSSCQAAAAKDPTREQRQLRLQQHVQQRQGQDAPPSPRASKREANISNVAAANTIDSNKNKQGQRTLRDEEAEGRADWGTIDFFARLGGYRTLIAYMVFALFIAVFNLFADVVLANWANSLVYDAHGHEGAWDKFLHLRGFMFWFCCALLSHFSCMMTGIIWSIAMSDNLFAILVSNLLRAPVDRFHDKTPMGRIMNRMSQDLSSVDWRLSNQLGSCVYTVAAFVVPMFYIHYVMPLFFTLAAIPFYALLFSILGMYWNTMVPLRYLCATTKSIVTNYFTDVKEGALIARFYRVTESAQARQRLASDNNLKAEMVSGVIRRWLLNRALVLYGFVGSMVGLLAVFCPEIVTIGAASLSIVSIAIMMQSMEVVLDVAVNLQYHCVCMNRLHEYTQLPSEAADVLSTDSRYESFTATVKRADLGPLVRWQDENGKLRILRGKDSTLSSNDRAHCFSMCGTLMASGSDLASMPRAENSPLLVQAPEGAGFVAMGSHTLSALCPSSEALREAHPWHTLVAVGDFDDDVGSMAEELCFGSSETVTLSIRSGWLRQGASVEITDLYTGYADLKENVLRGVTFSVPRKAKCAIVGQTGCGKSSLVLSLLRLLEPRGGHIEIEGVNLQDIGLTCLRRAVGVVPQDPVLFTGTIRTNLDPFREYADKRLWQALHAVQIDGLVNGMPKGLDSEVKSGGSNLSFGQRQLLCIARMVLRQPALLLLDEATSAVDPNTQELVQNAIRSQFPNSTILAIAHRLETIMDFDMAVVLDAGQVIEQGPLSELASRSNGPFARALRHAQA